MLDLHSPEEVDEARRAVSNQPLPSLPPPLHGPVHRRQHLQTYEVASYCLFGCFVRCLRSNIDPSPRRPQLRIKSSLLRVTLPNLASRPADPLQKVWISHANLVQPSHRLWIYTTIPPDDIGADWLANKSKHKFHVVPFSP